MSYTLNPKGNPQIEAMNLMRDALLPASVVERLKEKFAFFLNDYLVDLDQPNEPVHVIPTNKAIKEVRTKFPKRKIVKLQNVQQLEDVFNGVLKHRLLSYPEHLQPEILKIENATPLQQEICNRIAQRASDQIETSNDPQTKKLNALLNKLEGISREVFPDAPFQIDRNTMIRAIAAHYCWPFILQTT